MDFTFTCAIVEVIKSTCQSFFLVNPVREPIIIIQRVMNGLDITGSQVVEHCGMNYTGSSCEDVYISHPETGDKSGYYRINDTQWKYCNTTAITASSDFFSMRASVGGGLLILPSVQEMIVWVIGGRSHNLVLASIEWPVMANTHVLLPFSLLME